MIFSFLILKRSRLFITRVTGVGLRSLCIQKSCIVKKRNTYRTLERISERKRPLGRPRSKWEDNIKMDSKGYVESACTAFTRLRIIKKIPFMQGISAHTSSFS